MVSPKLRRHLGIDSTSGSVTDGPRRVARMARECATRGSNSYARRRTLVSTFRQEAAFDGVQRVSHAGAALVVAYFERQHAHHPDMIFSATDELDSARSISIGRPANQMHGQHAATRSGDLRRGWQAGLAAIHALEDGVSPRQHGARLALQAVAAFLTESTLSAKTMT
jgi:hypothetical protein